MAPKISNMNADDEDNFFDMDPIFIGREQQLDLFRIYLNRWRNLLFDIKSESYPAIAAPSPNNKIQGMIVLLFGPGGIGKSSLLQRFRSLALQDSLPFIVTDIIDWEFAVKGKHGLFEPPQSNEIDAYDYFKLISEQLATALRKKPQDFKAYQLAAKDVEKAHKDANATLDNLQKDDHYSWLRGLAIETITSALSTYVPGSRVILANSSVKTAINETARITQGQISQLHARLHARLGNRLDDYLSPALRLGFALGHDLSEVAKNYPLLIFFDTYEEIDEADSYLRIVIHTAGPRVGWILAGRDNLWAGSEFRGRSIALEYGYEDIVLPERALAINFASSDVGAFTLNDIIEYFALLRKQLPNELLPPRMTKEEAKRILDVTLGVPLAVKIAASLYVEKIDLNVIAEKSDGKRAIVDQMVRRYLLHARSDQSERFKLYGLALLRRADQPITVAAALGLSEEKAATDYTNALSHLHKRYSFVLTEKEEPSLHQDVRYFLRLWLLEHYKDPEIRAINQQLREVHEANLKLREDQRTYYTLKERLLDEEWVGLYLDLVEQVYWLNPDEGIHYALPFMIASAIYNYDACREIVKIGKIFEKVVKSPCNDWWQWGIHGLLYNNNRYYLKRKPVVYNPFPELKKLANLITRHNFTFPPLPSCHSELEALLWWRMGRAYEDQDDTKALDWYEKSLSRLDREVELREDAARTYYHTTYRLMDEKKYFDYIRSLNRAIEIKNDFVWAYNSRGIAYSKIKEYRRAIEDYNQAITIDPLFAYPYYNRGLAYYELKEHQNTITDCNRAIELESSASWAYHVRGLAYLWLRNIEQARSDYNNCYLLDPKDINAAWMEVWMEMSKEAIGIETALKLEKIADMNQQHYSAYVCRGIALGLQGKLKDGLAELEKGGSLEPDDWDPYFWKGMLCAYYYPSKHWIAKEAIDKALKLNLPPVLLTPLYWLEKDRPEFFKLYVKPLIEYYDV